MGHTIGEDPVSPVTASTRLIRVKHTIDIYQDQRGKLLHASTVRGRPATGHTHAWLRSHRPWQPGRLANATHVPQARRPQVRNRVATVVYLQDGSSEDLGSSRSVEAADRDASWPAAPLPRRTLIRSAGSSAAGRVMTPPRSQPPDLPDLGGEYGPRRMCSGATAVTAPPTPGQPPRAGRALRRLRDRGRGTPVHGVAVLPQLARSARARRDRSQWARS